MKKSRVPKLEIWGFPAQEKLDHLTHMVETAWTRRIEPNPREQFILTMELFAIFCICSLWGLKTPAICFVFCRFHEEDSDVGMPGWFIPKNARVYIICVCFLYYFHYPLYYQIHAYGVVESDVAINHWDLGSIPRSTKNSILFFFTRLCAGFQRGSIIHLTKQHAKWPPR